MIATGLITFDPTISLGTIIAVITILIGAWKLNNNLVGKLTEIETKLSILWRRYERETNEHSGSPH